MSRVIRVMGAKYHPDAECESCDWSEGPTAATREAAKTHTKATGHRTIVETVERDVYGREER